MTEALLPDNLLGLWRRDLLEQDGEIDTTTLVLVIQTQPYHVDIRIPAARPDFSNVSSLQDCGTTLLHWLAKQQGFTGVTEVNGSIMQWIRDYDYQPSNGARDIGEMFFDEDGSLIETGVDADYREVWKIIPDTQHQLSLKTVSGVNRHGTVVFARMVTAGKYFAYIRPRSVELPKAASMSAAIEVTNPNADLLMDWLDFEISFGDILDDQNFQIKHSTLPFREGQLLDLKQIYSQVVS